MRGHKWIPTLTWLPTDENFIAFIIKCQTKFEISINVTVTTFMQWVGMICKPLRKCLVSSSEYMARHKGKVGQPKQLFGKQVGKPKK